MLTRLILLLRAIAWWLLRSLPPAEDEIDAALRGAMADIGLDPASYAPELDLGTKRYQVLDAAAKRLGNPLRTVADIRALLR